MISNYSFSSVVWIVLCFRVCVLYFMKWPFANKNELLSAKACTVFAGF
jgi:hypothetical protein